MGYTETTWADDTPPPISGANLNKMESGIKAAHPVVTIADLKSISTTGLINNDHRFTLGYYAAGDGGDGLFRWNSASTSADNGGTVIMPSSAPSSGRWHRVFSGGVLNVRWFGADPAQSAAVQKTAIQAALTAASSGKLTVYVPPGLYSINGALSIPDSVGLVGPSFSPQLADYTSHTTVIGLANSTNTDMINFSGTGASCRIENLVLNGNKANQTTTTLAGIRMPTTGSDTRTWFYLNNVFIHDVKGTGVVVPLTHNEISFERVVVMYCDSHGYQIDAGDILIHRCLAGFNGGSGIYVGTGSTWVYSVRLTQCDVFFNNIGLNLRANAETLVYQLQANDNNQQGIYLDNPSPGGSGLHRFVQCPIIRNSRASNGTYSEVLATSASLSAPNAVFVDCKFGQNGSTSKYAFESVGTAGNRNTFLGCEFNEGAFGTGITNDTSRSAFGYCIGGTFGAGPDMVHEVPSPTQTLTASTAITATNKNIKVTAAGAITSTAAPTIANGKDGQVVEITNVGANNITLQDQGTLASSNLRLGATTRVLGTRDSLCLKYSSDVGDWLETSFSNVL